MAISPFYRRLRQRIGTDLLLIPGVAAIVRDDAGRMLVQRNQLDQWSLPAGSIEPGELPAAAVAREVLEETGLIVRATCIAGVVGGGGCRVTYPHGDQVEYVVTVFRCEPIGGSLIEENDETRSLHWFTRDAMPALAFTYPDEILWGSGPAAHFEPAPVA